MPRVTANYVNSYGKVSVNMSQNINFRRTIRVVRDGAVLGERCKSCSGLRFSKGRISPTLSSSFQHKKGCKLA